MAELVVGFVWVENYKLKCDSSNIDAFWQSIGVWIEKPHILNKRIGAVEVIDIGTHNFSKVTRCVNYFKDNLTTFVGNKFNSCITFIQSCVNEYKAIEKEDLYENAEPKCDVILRILYQKTGEVSLGDVDIVVKDKYRKTISFIRPIQDLKSKVTVNISYSIVLDNEYVKLFVPVQHSDNDTIWLSSILMPKIISWMRPELNKSPTYSNKLVSPEKYLMTYNALKRKYFNAIQEIWSESTNPQKFIIEDIAIATYLHVLWGERSQKFIDLGCGNGLLVYILNSEGHLGVGLDVRSRKIWKSFGEKTVLKESTISPSLDCIFPDVDWLIGNHSDELTPWIPVMAANSSYNTNFFLLPCCHFEFCGNKYARNSSNKSCYEEYMDYVEQICETCGFKFDKDRMKIPSTKRICFVSRGRVYSESEYSDYKEKIMNYVNSRMRNSNVVKTRDYKETVRNCTQLNKDFLDEAVTNVANYILSKSSNLDSWREGELTNLKELIELFPSEKRLTLKNECGGLQTLLKNHHHIFLVKNGMVQLRKPTVRNIPDHLVKTKDCWFFLNHPDSCPLPDDKCSYRHTR